MSNGSSEKIRVPLMIFRVATRPLPFLGTSLKAYIESLFIFCRSKIEIEEVGGLSQGRTPSKGPSVTEKHETVPASCRCCVTNNSELPINRELTRPSMFRPKRLGDRLGR